MTTFKLSATEVRMVLVALQSRVDELNQCIKAESTLGGRRFAGLARSHRAEVARYAKLDQALRLVAGDLS